MQSQPWLNNPICVDYLPIENLYSAGIISVAIFGDTGSFQLQGKFSRDGADWPDDAAAYVQGGSLFSSVTQTVSFNGVTGPFISVPPIKIVRMTNTEIRVFVGRKIIGIYTNAHTWGW